MQDNIINVEIFTDKNNFISKNYLKIINKIIELFKLLSEIGCLICISFICSLSIKDPFENHIINDKDFNNYFYYNPDFPLIIIFQNQEI